MNKDIVSIKEEDKPLIWINPKVLKMKEEIERLKEDIRVFKFTIKTQQEQIQELIAREDKAIEYIEKNCILSDTWKDLDFCNFVPIGKIKYKPLPSKKVKKLLDILKGVDKE